MAKILIVDDEPGIQAMIKALLTMAGHESVTAEDGLKALELITNNTFDLIITDLRMPRMDGLSLIRKVAALGTSIPVILVTGYTSPETASEAIKLGVCGYLAKPFKIDELLSTVGSALGTGKNA